MICCTRFQYTPVGHTISRPWIALRTPTLPNSQDYMFKSLPFCGTDNSFDTVSKHTLLTLAEGVNEPLLLCDQSINLRSLVIKVVSY